MYQNLLQTISQFIALTGDDEALIGNLFKVKRFEKGEHFLMAGDVCRQVGFINKGIFRFYLNRDGDDLTYYFSAENEFISDYPSFLSAQPSEHNIEALEAAETITISYDGLQTFYREIKQGERFGRLVAETLFVQTLGQLVSLYRDAPEIRYRNFVRQFPHLVERMPQYYIASYVGVKPPSLSRIRRRFAAQ